MHGNITGLLLTVSLILFCWTLSYIIKRNRIGGTFCEEIARKIVHIGVSNFAFIYLYIFDSDTIPLLGLIAFAVINLVIELKKRTRSFGTVQFPLSVAFIIVLSMAGFGCKKYTACALLAMGYGDGFAPFAGMLFPRPLFPFCKKKTLAGFLCVFAVTSAVLLSLGGFGVIKSLVCAICAALCEVYTPFSLDNVSVPIVIYLMEAILV